MAAWDNGAIIVEGGRSRSYWLIETFFVKNIYVQQRTVDIIHCCCRRTKPHHNRMSGRRIIECMVINFIGFIKNVVRIKLDNKGCVWIRETGLYCFTFANHIEIINFCSGLPWIEGGQIVCNQVSAAIDGYLNSDSISCLIGRPYLRRSAIAFIFYSYQKGTHSVPWRTCIPKIRHDMYLVYCDIGTVFGQR